jgi:hypothetical protein
MHGICSPVRERHPLTKAGMACCSRPITRSIRNLVIATLFLRSELMHATDLSIKDEFETETRALRG